MIFSLRLLGPVALRRGSSLLPLPTQKAQALLVLLALGGTAPRARIAAWLWPELDDSSARRNLRRELARLRDAGATELLLAEGETLALAATLHCDALQFQRQAPHDPEAALALWLGPPADGLQLEGAAAFADWLQAERTLLVALRHGALRGAAAAHHAPGRPAAALARLPVLLAAYPLPEQAH
ncbi:BTAD domain-containing putative transcriptional regulator, partial [Rubrivivax sp. A210]|uniref:AfsR/SARP family transcriptional regulator n=1 Tax=Rubrivivax sp. A210 TaxID=2772301 RepID=UPI002873E81A